MPRQGLRSSFVGLSFCSVRLLDSSTASSSMLSRCCSCAGSSPSMVFANRFGVDSGAFHSNYNQRRRTIVHVPLMGLLASFAAKKVALVALVRKFGIERTFEMIREANDALLRQSPKGVYTKDLHGAVRDGIEKVERTTSNMSEDDRIKSLFRWLENVDKNNPHILSTVLKTFVEAQAPLKWMRAMGMGGSSSAKKSDNAMAVSSVDAKAAEDAVSRIYAAHPEIRANYHVVLIPRKWADDEKE